MSRAVEEDWEGIEIVGAEDDIHPRCTLDDSRAVLLCQAPADGDLHARTATLDRRELAEIPVQPPGCVLPDRAGVDHDDVGRAVEHLERIRFTSPHPAAFTDDVIAAMAETPTVMPQLHMPLQSGSDRILRAMRRSYRSDKFLGILERVRGAMPAAAITTDIIVGFPGETEADFAETLRVVESARFASAFTFQYSPRPGTPAADLPEQLPKAVVQERYERLTALQDRTALEESQAQVGRVVEVLIADSEGRKDETSHRISGRAADNRLVHLALPPGTRGHAGVGSALPDDVTPTAPRPGDLVAVTVTRGAPHYLVADSGLAPGGTFEVRRTRAGDAWSARQSGSVEHSHVAEATGCGTSVAAAGPILLGLPTLGARPR